MEEDASVKELKQQRRKYFPERVFIDTIVGTDFGSCRGGVTYPGGVSNACPLRIASCQRSDVFIFDDSFSALEDYRQDAPLCRKRLKETQEMLPSLIVALLILGNRGWIKLSWIRRSSVAELMIIDGSRDLSLKSYLPAGPSQMFVGRE